MWSWVRKGTHLSVSYSSNEQFIHSLSPHGAYKRPPYKDWWTIECPTRRERGRQTERGRHKSCLRNRGLKERYRNKSHVSISRKTRLIGGVVSAICRTCDWRDQWKRERGRVDKNKRIRWDKRISGWRRRRRRRSALECSGNSPSSSYLCHICLNLSAEILLVPALNIASILARTTSLASWDMIQFD